MRLHSRFVLGFYGLSMAAATGAAAPPDGSGFTGMPSSSAAPVTGGMAPVLEPAVDASAHHHKSLFGRRHCVACQRALAKKESGIDVPPPPGFANDPTAHIHGVGITEANCPRCKALGVVVGPVIAGNAEKPGFAVVDGSSSSREQPGFAVVNGSGSQSEPAPIGISRAGQMPWAKSRMASADGQPRANFDPAVVPSSIPPAQVPVSDPKHSRPHIIGHLLGVSQIRKDMRTHREARREQGPAHASIRYDQGATTVSEIPASVVRAVSGDSK